MESWREGFSKPKAVEGERDPFGDPCLGLIGMSLVIVPVFFIAKKGF